MPTRREVLLAGGSAALSLLVAACTRTSGPGSGTSVSRAPTDDRTGGSTGDTSPASLTAHPDDAAPGPAPEPGTRPLGVEESRDALLHVPAGLPPDQPVPLVLTLHGAGGDAEGGMAVLRPLADRHGFVLLSPASRGRTWDAVGGGYGGGVDVVDRALAAAFGTVRVDPERLAVAGFSDGASYALGLGLANGDLLGHVMAFSPGFIPPGGRSGRPEIFVSHGEDDEVLPVDRTSRRIVAELREDGYEVTYREFAGGHTLPPEVVEEAVDWLGWGPPA